MTDDVAEGHQRERGDHDAGKQQRVKSREHSELGVLLVVLELLHGVHEALEHPEVHHRVHAMHDPHGARLPCGDIDANLVVQVAGGRVLRQVGVVAVDAEVKDGEDAELERGLGDAGAGDAQTHADEDGENTGERANEYITDDG